MSKMVDSEQRAKVILQAVADRSWRISNIHIQTSIDDPSLVTSRASVVSVLCSTEDVVRIVKDGVERVIHHELLKNRTKAVKVSNNAD